MSMHWGDIADYWDATLKIAVNFRKAHSRLADAQERIASAQEKRAESAAKQADALERILAALDLDGSGPAA